MNKNCSANDTLFIENYDPFQHYIGLAFVLFFSSVGILSTIFLGIQQKVKKSSFLNALFFFFQFFGTGVIGSTAWIHILPDAFEDFDNPCFKDTFWEDYGTNWVGLFGIIASFLVQLIEFGFISKNDAMNEQSLNRENVPNYQSGFGHGHGHTHEGDPEDIDMIKDFGTYSLEAGILFHSLVIGIALGVAVEDFVSLTIAICFHQFFEGIALGVRISELRTTVAKKIFFGILYPLTTPGGILIGILAYSSFSYETPYSLLFKGIINSLSAGILIYNTYVELIGASINMNKEFRNQRFVMKFFCFFSLYLGAMAMAYLAIWA